MTPSQSSKDSDLTVISEKTLAYSSQVKQTTQSRENALPIGTRLEEFEINDIIGWGGFGIVYLAFDHILERQVALKEYMPYELAVRIPGTTTVAIKSEYHSEAFQAGLHSFINDEAKLLAHFNHASLVKVYRFWESNGTAYMAMPFYRGVTLKDKLRNLITPPDEEWLKFILSQILDALSELHKDNCIHRDIAPDNILILSDDDKPLLLDFGAARRVIGDMTQALTMMLKPGYAPIEQYGAENALIKQGPWTDIYALAAVVYFAIIGKTPTPSVDRILSDTLVPLTKFAEGQYSANFLRCIDKSLAIKPEDRPKNVDEFRTLLGLNQTKHEKKNNFRTKYFIVTPILTITIIVSVILFYTSAPNQEKIEGPDEVNVKEPFSPIKALEKVFDSRNRDHLVTVFVEKTQVLINKDEIKFKIHSSKSGYLYLLAVGTNRSSFYLFFPNTVDQENFIEANGQLELPRKNWTLKSRGPSGMNHFIAIVSNYPRDFSSAGLHQNNFFAEFPLLQASQLYDHYTGSPPLFAGKAICPPNLKLDCIDSYGAALFSIEEIEG